MKKTIYTLPESTQTSEQVKQVMLSLVGNVYWNVSQFKLDEMIHEITMLEPYELDMYIQKAISLNDLNNRDLDEGINAYWITCYIAQLEDEKFIKLR